MKKSERGLDTLQECAVTALPSKHSSGCHITSEEKDKQRTARREIWTKNVDKSIQVQLEEDGDGST